MELHSLCLFLSYQLEINTTAATTSNQMMNVNLSLLLAIKYTIAAIDQCQIERSRSSYQRLLYQPIVMCLLIVRLEIEDNNQKEGLTKARSRENCPPGTGLLV